MNYHRPHDRLYHGLEPMTTSEVRRVPIEPGLAIDVAIADARSQPDDPTVLFFLPWGEYVRRPDATARYRLLATAMGARVVAVDNLGMGPEAGRIPSSIRHDIERGDLRTASQLQLEAMQRLSVDLAHVELMGYSLGTAMASRFARELDGYGTVDRLTLGEPVGTRHQHTVPLMGKFAHEIVLWARNRRTQLEIHPDWMPTAGVYGPTIRHFSKNLQDYMSYPRGLATAPIPRDLVAAYGHAMSADTPIHIVNGGESIISTTADNQQFVRALEAMGYTTVRHDVYEGEAHEVVDVPRKIIPMLTDR